ncbi:MAG: tyrosine--tRNA ligase [Clostridia bacterium]|jgi:tyrosyl-tRNA synthetase|nr:tyrosine--tRNA ligase [Clostridia bacterium]
MQNVFDTLERRGYVEQLTHPEEIKKIFATESVPFYIGIDPTADSLHVGHFISLMVASHMQKAGHKPIILMGGGTAIIGDPSGKTDMRKMLTVEDIDNNVAQIKKQIEKFLSFEGENAAIIVNNGDWLRDLNYINFMKEIGVHFSVNRMLAAECYKNRLDTGLTFFELGYMLMQSYDFLYLHDHYGCKLQMGGNDQWSNIIGGVELIRKIGAEDSYGFTFKLLTTKEGKKMGKTEKGALWLNAEKTSPYEFYQYWRNVADDDIENVMKLLTFIEPEEIEEMTKYKDERINEAKKVAAFEITKLVHGEEEARKAEEATNAMFSGNGNIDAMEAKKVDLNAPITQVIVDVGMAPSKGQAKTLISQGAITLNDEKISDIAYVLKAEDFTEGYAIIRKGKKVYYKLVK